MDSFVTGPNYGGDGIFLCLGVVINTATTGNYNYHIRYNTTGINWEVPSTLDPTTD